MRKRWTQSELDFVRDNYMKMPAKLIAEHLSRPVGIVVKKASRMGMNVRGNLVLQHERAVYRFMSRIKIAESGCWEWQGTLNNYGYGMMGVKGDAVSAHRFSYELHIGEITDGLLVCHKCDNRRCCNPDHLFLGTNLDNILDCVRKGRRRVAQKNGENNGTIQG